MEQTTSKLELNSFLAALAMARLECAVLSAMLCKEKEGAVGRPRVRVQRGVRWVHPGEQLQTPATECVYSMSTV